MINIIDELKKRFGIVSPSDKTRATGLYEISLNLTEVYYKEGIDYKNCLICSRRHTMECPNSSKCFSLENKPYFKEEHHDSN